jgi:hypothetical protein
MPVAIDEVTAEVAAPEGRAQSAQGSDSPTASPAELRRQREQFERIEKRAARVCAD